MKNAPLALIIGIGVEALLVGALMVGGFGPYGPASPVSAFVFFIHTPGLSLMQALKIPDPDGLILVATGYTAVWSAIAYFILARPSGRDSG